ncbi:MAG TPA: hypothetical protein VD790_06065 [Thermoleophilaceae bacterium]|nr:hypothetical protein [Thermoleophilaceae bacterium]
MRAPQIQEPPPPPFVVPARRELERFGWAWIAFAGALAAAALASGSTASLEVNELLLILAMAGLTLGCVLGALLLARRTGPEVLYYRILDPAPPPPPAVPWERPAATSRRIMAPATALVIGLLLAALVGTVMIFALGGQPRDEIREDLAGGTLLAGAAWTFTCGLAGLRTATYFRRWERLRNAVVLCAPLKAGTMRPVYWVERA